jgi:hypothetical protein
VGRVNRSSSIVMRKLRQLDADGDGSISPEELNKAVQQLLDEERSKNNYRNLACAALGVLIFIVFANIGLAFGRDLKFLNCI